MKELFAQRLHECLKARYGKLPSAATVARDFNLRAYGVSPITQESARRWMRGQSFPKPEYLEILLSWLGISLDPTVLTPEKRAYAPHSPVTTYRSGYIKPMHKPEECISRLITSLNPNQKKLMIELIKTCFINQREGGGNNYQLKSGLIKVATNRKLN